MTLVDTSVWVDALRGLRNEHTLWLNRNLTAEDLGLTDLVMCEVLRGIPNDALFRQAKEYLSKFVVYDTAGADLAIASAESFRMLRRNGITVRSTIDCVIATFCVREGYSLLHHDRDFEGFERYLGLSVIHPES